MIALRIYSGSSGQTVATPDDGKNPAVNRRCPQMPEWRGECAPGASARHRGCGPSRDPSVALVWGFRRPVSGRSVQTRVHKLRIGVDGSACLDRSFGDLWMCLENRCGACSRRGFDCVGKIGAPFSPGRLEGLGLWLVGQGGQGLDGARYVVQPCMRIAVHRQRNGAVSGQRLGFRRAPAV
jgi:hypothetical protein